MSAQTGRYPHRLFSCGMGRITGVYAGTDPFLFTVSMTLQHITGGSHGATIYHTAFLSGTHVITVRQDWTDYAWVWRLNIIGALLAAGDMDGNWYGTDDC